ncbi:MAG: hypothetical protein JF588_11110 [Caulobacterales bacterium]|nr:hypothetical protein [Caulobacterales bacterium]
MCPLRNAAALATVLLLSLAAPQAQAQAYVADICQASVTPAALRFDSAEHSRWYKRFWTGECDHILGCVPGSPNWNAIMRQLVTRASPAERAQLLPKACRLGQLVGLDWSREHGVRKITTQDLRRLYAILEQGDPLNGVEHAEAAARAQLGR